MPVASTVPWRHGRSVETPPVPNHDLNRVHARRGVSQNRRDHERRRWPPGAAGDDPYDWGSGTLATGMVGDPGYRGPVTTAGWAAVGGTPGRWPTPAPDRPPNVVPGPPAPAR